MSAARLPTVVGWQGLDAVLYGRVYNISGVLITQATIDSIAYKIIDLDNNRQVAGSGSLSKTSVVFDTEQDDDFWPHADGYNVRAVIPGAGFSSADTDYEIQVQLTPGSGTPIMLAGQLHTRKVD